MKKLIVLLALIPLVGCSGAAETYSNMQPFPSNGGIVSQGSSASATVVFDPEKSKKVCLGRGADSAFETEDSGDINLTLVSIGGSGKTDSEESNLSNNTGEEEMVGRTPALLLTRELLYRSCELAGNYNLTKEEATKLYLSTIAIIAKGWSAEASKTTITIGDTLTTQDSITRSDTGTDTTAPLPAIPPTQSTN